MADNDQDHEHTPLLQDQDDIVNDQHNHHNETSHRDVVGNIRNLIENEIPNGHHVSSSTSAPKRVHALLPRLFTIINSLVDCANVEDEVVTDEVVEYLCSLGQEVVYGLLRCVETMVAEGQRDVGRKRLLDRRAEVCQVAAAAVTKAFVNKDRMGTYCHVLTRPYYAIGEERNTAENAIEIAIRVHATDFIADIEVQRCVQALWTGLILQVEDEESRIRFIEYSGLRRTRRGLLDWFDIGRLNVPKYQNNMKIAMFIVFLAMYTFVVNNRSEDPNIFEWLMYVFVCGYIFEEFRLIFEGGTAFFLGSIWHWINIISYSMFMVSFSFRFSASYLLTDTLKIMKYNVIASDLQALLAIFLWVKTLSLLDGNQYFGTMVMVLQNMLKDGIMFFWLLAWVFIGFLQSFYALQTVNENESRDFVAALTLLVRGFLQDPDWEVAEKLDVKYGFWVFALYLFLTSIILLNLLIALFNSSYTNITDSSEKEYLALFTFKVFSYLKSPDQFPYAAPFNLIEVFFVIPFSVILSRENYKSLNRVVMGTLFWIPILAIAHGEQKRYEKLRDTNDDDDISGGRRRYRHLTLDDISVEDLFMMESSDEEDGAAETTIHIANGEEGVITDAHFTGWKAYGPGNETFSDFQRRRVKESEARAKAAAAAARAEEASSSSDEDERADAAAAAAVASSVTAGSAVSEALVQTLLASIARMEERQKEMETLLKQLTPVPAEAEEPASEDFV